MGMTVQVEINEIRDCAGRPAGRDITRSYETSETLEHFDIHQVRRMTFVVVAKEAFFESYANWRLHGRQLFYRRRQQVLVVDVLETPRPTVSAPRPALDLPADVVAFDVDPAGDRFVIARRAAPAAPANEVRVITNWWSVAAARDGAGKTAGLAQR
jgi:hypothetical protein